MSESRKIHCCGCAKKVDARLTNGAEIYPHRPDLHRLPFWICDTCKNYVGCHHKTTKPTNPLGVIPTPELKAARYRIHQVLDPLWKGGKMTRRQVYKILTERLGWQYHTAKIQNMHDARRVITIAGAIRDSLLEQ